MEANVNRTATQGLVMVRKFSSTQVTDTHPYELGFKEARSLMNFWVLSFVSPKSPMSTSVDLSFNGFSDAIQRFSSTKSSARKN